MGHKPTHHLPNNKKKKKILELKKTSWASNFISLINIIIFF